MELKSLRYFVAVAEAGILASSALQLNMAQPPLSVQIRNLEQRIGVALFRRTARGMSLTDAGSALLVHARESLSLAREGVAAARAVAAGRRGQITIGYMFALGYDLLPKLLPELRRRAPDLELRFVEMSARNALPLVLDHAVNLALCMPAIQHEDIHTEVVASPPWRLAVHSTSPLAALRSVPISRLQGEPLISLPTGPGGAESSAVQALLRRHRVTMPVAHRVETVHAALALVLAGEGLAILPACVAAMSPARVVLRPLQRVQDSLDVAACWRRDAPRQPLQEALAAVRHCYGRTD